MKLILTLLVRNEEDIIRENILYHKKVGIDHIIVTDNNSEDSTLDILKELEQDGIIHLINEPNDDYSQSTWVSKMANIAYEEYNADWVINSDADEFWWSESKCLKTTLSEIPEEYVKVQVQRKDFVPLDNLEGNIFNEMVYKNLESRNHIGNKLPPKMCHRGIKDVVVAMGNHDLVEPSGLAKYDTDDIEIFHFPMRTYKQFENKIKYGGAALQRNKILPSGAVITWRVLYEQYLKGKLYDYYIKKLYQKSDLRQGLNSNIILDDRLLNFLIDEKIIEG